MTEMNHEPGVDLLEVVWTSVIDLGAELDEREWKMPSELPGWTVQDNLSHIIGTERMMRGDPTPANEPASTDHVRNPIGELNEHWVEHYRHRTGADVLDEFRRLSAERLAELRAMPPERFDEIGPTPVGQAPFREFVNVRIFDSWIHEQDMRRALGRPGHLHGPAVDHSMGRMVAAMPFVVGKKAGASDGTSVVFVVTGDDPDAAPYVVAVVVDGRASVVDAIPDDPTVQLALDLSTYIALGTGRGDPDTALGGQQVTITGDEALGRTVIRQMSFMI